MKFKEFSQKESPKDHPKNSRESQENREKEGEQIIEERAGILERLVQRLSEEQQLAVEDMVDLPKHEVQMRIYNLFKKVPMLRAHMVANEAITGAEPGRVLNTKERIMKAVVSIPMFIGDVGRVISGIRGESIPKNIFKGKSLAWLEQQVTQAEQADPKGNKAILLRAIHTFLKENEGEMHYFEDKLHEAVEQEGK